MSAGNDVIDLFASGDKAMILCVLRSTLSGAVLGGVAGNAIPGVGSGLGAVLGGLGGYFHGYRACGAASTRGSFDRTFEDPLLGMISTYGRLPREVVDAYEGNLIQRYRLTADEARFVSQAAALYLASGTFPSGTPDSDIDARNSLDLLLRNAGLRDRRA